MGGSLVTDRLLLAARDRALRGSALAVYIILLRELSTQEPRRIKVRWLAREAQCSVGSACRALRRLAQVGYIICDSRIVGFSSWYHLPRQTPNCSTGGTPHTA
jgi:hypothetical protein